MLMTKVSIATISVTLIKLTSISGGRFEPPTVFAVRLETIIAYLSIFVKHGELRLSFFVAK